MVADAHEEKLIHHHSAALLRKNIWRRARLNHHIARLVRTETSASCRPSLFNRNCDDVNLIHSSVKLIHLTIDTFEGI